MPSAIDLHGIFAPIPTPFDAAGELDPAGLQRVVRHLGASSLHGILALGSNGEAALLDDDEGDDVVAAAREALPKGKWLIAGVGRESTRATCRAAERASAAGVDAVLVKAPSAFRTQVGPDALVAHFRAVADASSVPVLLYNLPGVTGFSLTAAVVRDVGRHPNVIGMKETSADLERLGSFAALPLDGFAVLSGWAPVIYPAMAAGAVGGILAVANVLPDVCVDLWHHARQGHHAEALALQRRLTPLAQLVTTGYGVPGLKFALTHLGVPAGQARAPLGALDRPARDAIVAALEPWIR